MLVVPAPQIGHSARPSTWTIHVACPQMQLRMRPLPSSPPLSLGGFLRSTTSPTARPLRQDHVAAVTPPSVVEALIKVAPQPRVEPGNGAAFGVLLELDDAATDHRADALLTHEHVLVLGARHQHPPDVAVFTGEHLMIVAVQRHRRLLAAFQ